MKKLQFADFHISHTEQLFKQFVDIIITILEHGLPLVQIDALEDDISRNYLKNGIELVKDGLMPAYVEVMLEYNFIRLINQGEISDQTLMDLLLIKKVIPIIQTQNLETFLDLNNHFCSMQIKVENNKRLNKYLPEHCRCI